MYSYHGIQADITATKASYAMNSPGKLLLVSNFSQLEVISTSRIGFDDHNPVERPQAGIPYK